jgi:cation transport regulator ChaB
MLMPRRGGRDETEVPGTIKRSDKHAQSIWKKTHDSAVETYGEGERAHRTAFSSLEHSYKKVDDHWEKKAQKGPSDPQAARSTSSRKKSYEDERPTAGGAEVPLSQWPREALYERAKQLDVKGRSSMNKDQLLKAVRRKS